MQEAYFEHIYSRITPYLHDAKSTIQIDMAWFTSPNLYRDILDCCDRKVQVELILLDNSINFMDFAPDFNLFIQKGGILKIAPVNPKFLHHKFCVIDDKIVITGSYNWTYYAENRNLENIIISDHADIVSKYKKEHIRISSLLNAEEHIEKLSIEQIRERNDTNFNDLNDEIREICIAQHQPVKQVFETKTVVVNKKLKPKAKTSIGLDIEGKFETLIKEDTELSAISSTHTYYLDTIKYSYLPCNIIIGNPDIRESWNLLKQIDFTDVAKGKKFKELPVKFSMRLDDDGRLRIDVDCDELDNLAINSEIFPNLVKYEE